MNRIVKLIIKLSILLIILVALIFLYSKYLNATGFKVKERTLYNEQLPTEFDGLKVVQISDIHYGISIHKQELKNIVKRINLIKPDIVFLTGDLLNKKVDYSEKDIETIIEVLTDIDTTINKYAVNGDNDDNEYWEEIIKNSGFINLNDTYKLIYKNRKNILVSGLSTSHNEINTGKKINDTIKYLNSNNMYSILVMHEPDEIKNIDNEKFNLILAGHSLGGQFRLPFIGGLIRQKGSKKYINEHYELNDTEIYISNGLGNSDIKYRFLNKPSFSLFRLRSESEIK